MSGPEQPTDPVPESTKPKLSVDELRKQLTVLERKLLDSQEPLVREALQTRVTEIMKELGPDLVIKPAAPANEAPKKKKEEEPLPEKPSAEDQVAADNLIRQARVCKMRNQIQEATDLVRQASEIAPGSAVVQEMLGDEYCERKRFGEARAAYKMAHRLDPTNVALETKFANLVLRTEQGMSFEIAMTKGDSLFVDASEATASAVAATVFSFFVPGIGQIVLGENIKGAILIGSWVLCGIMIRLGVEAKVNHFSVTTLGYVFIGLILVVYVVAISGCASRIKKKWTPARVTEKPIPPVDLPFE